MITLDPHTEQDAVSIIDDDSFPSFLNRHPRIINISECDTTMAFCFYLQNSIDAEYFYKTLEGWKEESQDYLIGIEKDKIEMDNTDKVLEFDDDFEVV